MIAEFSLAHPATRELLRAAAMVEPAPRGLVDAMVAMLESMHDPVRATAIELLARRTSAADVARWHGSVARVLARTPRPEDYVLRAALSALGTAARVDVAALPVLACWATGTEPVELRGMAVAALASASSAVDEQIPEALRAAARPLALAAFTAILARSEDDAPFRTAARAIAMTERDGAAASRLYADAVLANPHAAARVFLLGQMESQWSAAPAEVPRIELLTCDDNVDVRAAATAALARIAPAHRAEAAARTVAAADPRAAPAVPAPGAKQVDWLAYGEAFKAGQEAALRKLVDRGNVNLPMTMLGKATVVGPPINGVLSYCGFPQIPEAHLVVAIRLLVDLGADPTVRNNGAGDGSTMDYAVLACPPAVQAALGIRQRAGGGGSGDASCAVSRRGLRRKAWRRMLCVNSGSGYPAAMPTIKALVRSATAILLVLACVPAMADAVLRERVLAAAPGLAAEVLDLALEARDCAAASGRAPAATRLAVIDYSRPSTEPRLWLIDVEEARVLAVEHVAHGRGSGEDRATRFSNVEGSYQTSLGLYVANETYVGGNGYSLRLDGLDPGYNDRARERLIVMHGADYVDPLLALRQGRLGRSFGCPAVRQEVARELIDQLKGGQLLFAYYPDPAWLASSPNLGCATPLAARGTASGDGRGSATATP